MITELINPEDLEPGDVIIYPCLSEIRTAKIMKKPNKVISSSGQYHFFKTTRCLVNVQKRLIPGYNPQNRSYNEQVFNANEFNVIKYIRFNNPILKVIE